MTEDENTRSENSYQNRENQIPKTELPEQIESDNADDETSQNPDTENYPIENDRPSTKNLLGDNPPGAEEAAFNAGMMGDASAEQFKYNSENLVEGFRENIDKTEEALALDKKLKDETLD